MTARSFTDELGASRIEVRCDTCGTEAPPASEIIAAHGLIRLGWHCSGGVHICGGCPHPTIGDET